MIYVTIVNNIDMKSKLVVKIFANLSLPYHIILLIFSILINKNQQRSGKLLWLCYDVCYCPVSYNQYYQHILLLWLINDDHLGDR